MTRSACVVAGATVETVAPHLAPGATARACKLGVLVTGRIGDTPIDCATALGGPVYDVMYNATTGWFSVTIFRGEAQPRRWDNRAGQDAGYPRVDDVLGATTPREILAVLEVPAEAIGYAVD